MVLGDADPVEAELLDKAHPVDHLAISVGSGLRVVFPGRHGPFARQVWRQDIAAGFEIRDFHGITREAHRGERTALSLPSSLAPSRLLRQPGSPKRWDRATI